MKKAAILFGVQLCYYALLCISLRAIAAADYHLIAVFDFIIASFAFFIIRRVAQSETTALNWIAFATGGVLGSLCGTWLSQTFFS